MSTRPLLRFAPSPNGFLHLGHAYSALITDKWARDLGGTWLLRIEDIDLGRSKTEFIDAIYQDLHWLGLNWPQPVMIQSTRFAAYKKAAKRLEKMGLLYPCFCTRKDILTKATRNTDPDGAPIYPGTCKLLSKTQIATRLGTSNPVQYRLNTIKAMQKTGMLTFSVAGPTVLDRPQINYARPERWGDIVLVRKDTPTSYHLAVVVDDAMQNITHLTRGRDLQAITHIHVLVQFLLSLPTPLYTFHKLILDDEQTKLAKSKGSLSLRALREAGWTPDDIRAHLGFQ